MVFLHWVCETLCTALEPGICRTMDKNCMDTRSRYYGSSRHLTRSNYYLEFMVGRIWMTLWHRMDIDDTGAG